MKSSEISTDVRLTASGEATAARGSFTRRRKPDTAAASDFRPWHFFVLSALLAATVAVLLVRPDQPASLILLTLTIGAAALVAIALFRTLWPLAAADFREPLAPGGGRTRAGIEREKTLVLRSIKELEFDRAMGKVSEQDFYEMGARLRARAMSLIRQLDQDRASYREIVERELEARLSRRSHETRGRTSRTESTPAAEEAGVVTAPPVRACPACGTESDADARFCKQCGEKLREE